MASLALVAALLAAVSFAEPPAALADNTTVSGDTMRTGWDAAEPNLSPATVTGGNFGQLFATKVQGQVYAQPLVIGNTVVTATEDNYVYGLNAVNGAIAWQRSLGPAWPAATTGCADLTPNIGSTATGVYDPSSGYVYISTKVNDGPDANHPSWYLHAISATTGAERAGWPVKIVGTPANDPDHPFAAKDVNNRPGLLLMNGVVYLAFAGLCDYGSYVGWVAGVNTGNGAINLWSDEVGPSSQSAGIWHSGGGIMSDGNGRMFVATGNGIAPPNGPGSPVPGTLSQSVVRLGVDADGIISSKDFFSPYNATTLDQNDQDLGSGGPVALPDQYFGTAGIPHLMVQAGKEGRVYLLNRDNLGGKGQGPNGGDAVVQNLGPYHGFWNHPAVYGGEGGYVYIVQSYSSMLAFKYGVGGDGKPALTLAGNSAEYFGYTAGSPIVTSSGTTPGSAVVWVTNTDGPNGSNGRLCAYRAVPVNNQIPLLRCFPIGTASKFASPASSNGRLYAGTRDGYVYGFGQPTTAGLTTTQTSLGNVNVGQTGTGTVTATASRTVTVTAVSTGAPFAATPLSLPVTLQAGQTITVPVSFSPTTPGSATGTLNYTITDGGNPVTLGTTLQGYGIKPGFTGNTAKLDFGETPVGAGKSLTVSFTNTGTANETVTAVTAPGAPFAATGLPAAGLVVAPGQSVAVGVSFKPTSTGAKNSSIALTGANGTATIALTGSGVTGHAQLSIEPSSLAFGAVPVGLSVTKTLTVANTGNLNVTVTKAAPPALPFVVNTPLPEGLVLAPGDEVEVQVTFAPTAAGSFNNLYVISSDDGNGAHNVPVTGTATNPSSGAALPSMVGGGWVLNGAAAMNGSDLVLTPAASDSRGSAVYSTPLPSANLTASFTASIGGGSGADGMAFALLDASSNTANSLGGGGGGQGFQGLPGVAVSLDTYQGLNDPNANFIGVSTGGNGNGPTWVATATGVPNLRTGTHQVTVSTAGGKLAVSIDGTQVINATVTLPASTLLAFTAATGGATDRHAVNNVAISSGGTNLPAPGTGWRFNGSAAANGAEVVLTPAQMQQAGTALYSSPVATNGLSAQFNMTNNGGTGADGTTFLLTDPTAAPTSVGGAGGGLGWSGLPAVGVSFLTYPEAGVDSHNWVGIATSTAGGGITFLSSNTNIPDLRASAHDVKIQVSGTTVTVLIDGAQVLSTAVPALKPTALVGFAASTGGFTDVHAVRSAQIVAGATTTTLPAPPAANWVANGSTTITGGTVRLTAAQPEQTGTAIYASPFSPARLNATFTIRIGDGNGADGLGFMLLDATKSGPTSVGLGGGGLGFSGLNGVCVAFVTYPQPGYPSNNFVGISVAGNDRNLTFLSTATAIPNLRSGTHVVQVSAGGSGNLVVSIDGVQALNTTVALPASALVGFSGATGGSNDVHEVSNVSISY
ncbi:choice-of-anchor D domain-containing protein [Dactylosporangium matsuzakiense]|uniref:choice-of-anchor D domain-containing protein n=1 Tax=Dactylosporangium matsuzakiense TaxID=53360 RepID=UPI0022F33965|nr:choice-of-anchor D domain-containing protein [Dactylosporangium matsuzakiense]